MVICWKGCFTEKNSDQWTFNQKEKSLIIEMSSSSQSAILNRYFPRILSEVYICWQNKSVFRTHSLTLTVTQKSIRSNKFSVKWPFFFEKIDFGQLTFRLNDYLSVKWSNSVRSSDFRSIFSVKLQITNHRWYWITLPKIHFTERPFDRNTIWPNTVWPNVIWPKVQFDWIAV
jgi:hypothetical protein